MIEIHNPNLDSRKPGGNGDVSSLLAYIALVFLLFFGFQYVRQPQSPGPIPVSHVLSQTVQAETVRAPLPLVGNKSVAYSVNFGWLTLIAKPLYLALRFLHDHGIGNWGWSIIVLTVLFNLLIIWPRLVSLKTSLKMMRVQPKVAALKRRYAHLKINDPKREEMNAEMIALYKAEGTNMFGGCLPLLLQMPLLFAFVSVLRNAAELHQAHWLWLNDLSLPDQLHILPLLIIGSMALTQWITPASSSSPSQRWMLAILMPTVMGFSLWHYASGLSLYWLTGNLISLLVQLVVNRSKVGKEMHALATGTRIDPIESV